MKYNEESIYDLIEIIELYIYQQYGIEVNIIIQNDNYTNDGIKFHEWTMLPITINNEIYTKIKFSEMSIDDLIYCINCNMSIEDVIFKTKDILGGCLK